MNFDVNWPRWCWASIAKHFNDVGVANGIPVYVEGFVRATDDMPAWVELRIDGPFMKEPSDGAFDLRFEINLGIQVKETDNAYYDKVVQGIFLGAFVDDICVFKYGDASDDDQTRLGYLSLLPRAREKIVVSNFGRINSTVAMMQSSIEAHYRILLD